MRSLPRETKHWSLARSSSATPCADSLLSGCRGAEGSRDRKAVDALWELAQPPQLGTAPRCALQAQGNYVPKT